MSTQEYVPQIFHFSLLINSLAFMSAIIHQMENNSAGYSQPLLVIITYCSSWKDGLSILSNVTLCLTWSRLSQNLLLHNSNDVRKRI